VQATVLTTFPNTALADPTSAGPPRRDDRDRSPGHRVHRNSTHILNINMADIAAAANVSIRAVQCAFRRHLNTTPMAYLRAVRLKPRHHALLTADPSRGATVTDIAIRWGSTTTPALRPDYRHTYGVNPRHTLHNR